MRAMDAMTAEVITVDRDTSMRALAALLSESGISGVPFVGSRSSFDVVQQALADGATTRKPRKKSVVAVLLRSSETRHARSDPAR
jgi:CBS domain-containing protein